MVFREEEAAAGALKWYDDFSGLSRFMKQILKTCVWTFAGTGRRFRRVSISEWTESLNTPEYFTHYSL